MGLGAAGIVSVALLGVGVHPAASAGRPDGRPKALPKDLASLASRSSCPSVTKPVQLAVLLKTTVHYHETRLRDVLDSWGRYAQAMIVVSDAPIDDLPANAGFVVMPREDSSRHQPYVPPWRAGDPNTHDASGKEYATAGKGDTKEAVLFRRQLTERVMVGLQVLRNCLPEAEAVLMADDDTYVPTPMLTGALRMKFQEPKLVGKAVESAAFARPGAAPGRATHCGGGSGVLLTRGLFDALDRKGGLRACLQPPAASDHDDVALGLCVFKLLGIGCVMPPAPHDRWSCHSKGVPTSHFLEPSSFTRGNPHQYGPNAPFMCVPASGGTTTTMRHAERRPRKKEGSSKRATTHTTTRGTHTTPGPGGAGAPEGAGDPDGEEDPDDQSLNRRGRNGRRGATGTTTKEPPAAAEPADGESCGASGDGSCAREAGEPPGHPSWARGGGCARLDLEADAAAQKRWRDLLDWSVLPKGSEVFVCYDGRDVARLEKDPELRRPVFAEAAMILVEDFITPKEVKYMKELVDRSAKAESGGFRGGTQNAMVFSAMHQRHPQISQMLQSKNAQGTPSIPMYDDKVVNRFEERIGGFLRIPTNMHERALQLTLSEPSSKGHTPLLHHDKNRALTRRATSLVYLAGGPGSGADQLVGGETLFPALPRRTPPEVGAVRARGTRQRKYSRFFQKLTNTEMDKAPPLGTVEWNRNWPSFGFNDASSQFYGDFMELCKNASTQAAFDGADDGEAPLLAVAPVPGRAIFFWQESPLWSQGTASGEILPDIWHMGCPVVSGKKYFLQRFKTFNPEQPECERFRWCDFDVRHRKAAAFHRRKR